MGDCMCFLMFLDGCPRRTSANLLANLFFPAKGHIDKRMAEVSEKVLQGEKVEGKYLTYYLAQEKLSMKSIYGNVTELLLAGVDTVSIL